MHLWGDEDFDWKQLGESIDMVDSFMRFWGRIGVQSKEKYGTARIYVTFWDGSLHGALYPSYVFNQMPKWLWKMDLDYIGPFIRWTRLPKLVNWYQSKIYGIAYSRAIKKYPKVKIELVIHADCENLIKEYRGIMLMYKFRSTLETLIRRPDEDDDLLY